MLMGCCLVKWQGKEGSFRPDISFHYLSSSFELSLATSSCPAIPGEVGQGQRCEGHLFSLLPVWPQRTLHMGMLRKGQEREQGQRTTNLTLPLRLPHPMLPTHRLESSSQPQPAHLQTCSQNSSWPPLSLRFYLPIGKVVLSIYLSLASSRKLSLPGPAQEGSETRIQTFPTLLR